MPSHTGSRGWIGIRLDVDDVDWDQIELRLVEAYRIAAPKFLVAQLEAE